MTYYRYDRRVALRSLCAVTTPLPPSFPESEIGLMTKEEFLHFRNPGDKHHPSDSYDATLFKLNEDHAQHVGTYGDRRDRVTVEKLSGGFRVTDEDGKTVAIIHGGTAYYDNTHWKSRIPRQVFNGDKSKALDYTSVKQVKYLSEVAPLISPIAKLNEEKFPIVLQHTIVGGEAVTVRAEVQPRAEKGDTIAIFNSDGLVVAQASNEWGATLFMVAREYRGKGVGKVLGRMWYHYNPSFESGGFTPAGERNDLGLWRERVHDFIEQGWYSQLVREKRLSLQKLKEILSEAGEKPERVTREPEQDKSVKATGDILVYSDGEITFVVYDRAFLEEQDEKFIHGYGFFRDDSSVGTFLFRIEYDRAFADLTTKVALQMARDNGEDLYNGEGYHDMVEVEGIPGVVQDGKYLKVTRDLVPLKSMAQKERRLRKAADQYDEKFNTLLEMAESKWQ